MGSLTTLGVLMVQGGIRDDGAVSLGSIIVGGGLLAGCCAVIFNRLR